MTTPPDESAPGWVNTLAILAMIAGLFATALFEVLLLASAPNGKPDYLARLKAWMLAGLLVATLSLAGSIWLLVVGRPWAAVGVGSAPVAFAILAVVIIARVERP
ncbi:MAG: hypothetical protein HRU70_05095 [Phycisphaeraceae bacterium]|nr:MAG: hypothetical protein HRU70_05095 [Phycisphaeraceae bacterium]